jgi:hypothetical protein
MNNLTYIHPTYKEIYLTPSHIVPLIRKHFPELQREYVSKWNHIEVKYQGEYVCTIYFREQNTLIEEIEKDLKKLKEDEEIEDYERLLRFNTEVVDKVKRVIAIDYPHGKILNEFRAKLVYLFLKHYKGFMLDDGIYPEIEIWDDEN